MPIHCQKCQICGFLFHLNHKPKKAKLPSLGDTVYTLDRVNWHKGCRLVFHKCRVYGFNTRSAAAVATQDTHSIDRQMQIESQSLHKRNLVQSKDIISKPSKLTFSSDSVIVDGVKHKVYEESVLKDLESSIVCFPAEAEVGKLVGSHFDNTLWCLVRHSEFNEICVLREGTCCYVMRFSGGVIGDFDCLKYVYMTV